MPKPVYIICSESGSEDKLTGQASFFNLIDVVQIVKVAPTKPPEGVLVGKLLSIRMAAVWMKEEADSHDQVFEMQSVMIQPNADELVIRATTFSFTAPFHRIISLVNVAGFSGPGMLYVESRIRPIGGTEWLKQAYPIIIQDATDSGEPSRTTRQESVPATEDKADPTP